MSGEAGEGFRHTPYLAGGKPFAIGLSPFAPADWIEIDDRRRQELALKARILAEEGRDAFDETEGSQADQAECAERLAGHLARQFPDVFELRPGGLYAGDVDLFADFGAEPPLKAISRLVQEDLLMMRRSPEGWRLAAGSLCFPSTWRLADKIGRPMDEIHRPTPGFAGAMAERVARIFDHLRPEAPVERFNVSIYGDDRLRHHEDRQILDVRFPPGVEMRDFAQVRVERQTLTKMPVGGAILFTVRVHLDPIAAFARHANGAALARALADHVSRLSPDELVYKGVQPVRARLLNTLKALADEAESIGRPN